jgi:two-component sensor histidine kinase
MGQQKEVLGVLQEAQQIGSTEEGLSAELALTNSLLGQYYIDEQNFAAAESYLREANQVLEDIDGDAIQEIGTKKLLFTTLSARGKVVPPKMLDRYFTLRDSLYSNQKLKDLNEITERYDLAEVRAANAELDLAKASSDLKAIRSGNLLWGSVILLGLLTIGLLVLNRLRQREKKLAADLTESNAQITTLYDDLYHRTNNNLSRVINLLERQKSEAAVSGQMTDSLRVIERQIWVFTLLQRLLGKQIGDRINLRNYLDALTIALEESTAGQSEVLDVELSCPDQEVDSDFATNVGLIINELVTNSIKYARGLGDEIPVELKVELIAATQLEISYSDAGPRPEARSDYSTGGGRQLIDQLVQQLKGKEVETEAGGYNFRIIFPV